MIANNNIYNDGLSSEKPFEPLPNNKPFEPIDNFFLLRAINLDTELGHGSCRLITVIHSFADSKTGKSCFPGTDRIAKVLKCSVRNVQKILANPKVQRWVYRNEKGQFEFN
jgi:hypothetical protein